jgi:trans-2,3-dihydro-3-hydroxyanthranilate isomerase
MPPQFGHILERGHVARALGLEKDDLDLRFPVQEVSTGIPFVIVPVKTLEAVRRSGWQADQPSGLNAQGKGFLLFTPQTQTAGNDLHVRVFAPGYGVAEDPATGSANGCLAGYLARHRFFGDPRVDIRVEQGDEVGRPSLLLLRAGEKAGEVEVLVGGRAIRVARGKLG